jgi:hypothetical protein
MAAIANLAVQLTAITAPFTRGMKAASAPVRAFGAVINSANGQLSAFVGGLVGAAALGAGARFVKQQSEALDVLGKTSDQLGINVQTLKAYEIGARKSGVDQEKLTAGLTKYSQALSKAAAGDKAAKELFDDIGLDPDKLITQGLDGALRSTADALQGVTNQTDRLTYSTQLFGRSAGRDFLSFLEDGSPGLDAMQEDAKRLGAAFDRVDIAEVEAANDAFEDISIALENVGSVIAIKVAPFVTELSTRFAEAVAEGTNFGDKVTNAMRIAAKGVAYVMDAWKVLNIVIKMSQQLVLGFIDLVVKAFNVAGKMQNAFAKQLNKLLPSAMQIPMLPALDPIIEGLEDSIADIQKDIQKMIDEGWSSTKVDEYFDNVIKKSREAAAARVGDNRAVGESLRDALDLSDQKTAQVSLSGALNYLRNVARGTQINGAMLRGPQDAARVQQVSDPKLDQTNKLLGGILENTESQTAAYA